MSPSFRAAADADVSSIALLASHSFPALGGAPRDWARELRESPHGGVETLWVGEQGSELVAACRLFRFRQWIAGAALPVMGLGTVAIAPTHRRRGLAARLVTAGFHHALERGDVASALYPFRTGFYQRLGYGMAGAVLQYQLPPSALPDAPERQRVRLVAGAADREAVRQVYDAWAPAQTGQMQRPDAAWAPVWEDPRSGALYRSEDGRPEGYAVFRYLPSTPHGGRAVEVEEIAWLTPAARRGLLGWLASLGDQWEQVVYRAHPDEGFAELLSELRFATLDVPRWHYWFPAATQLLGPMFRLLDVARAWEMRIIDPETEMTVGLELRDEALPANAGSWRLRLQQGRVTAERGGGTADLTLRLDVSTLSRLFVGALDAATAARAGSLEADHPERLPALDRAMRVPRPWTFDRF